MIDMTLTLEALALPASRKAPTMSRTPKPEQPALPFEAPAKALPTRAPARPYSPPARASHGPYPSDRPYVVALDGSWSELRREPGDSYPTPPMLPTPKRKRSKRSAEPEAPTMSRPTPAPSSATSTPSAPASPTPKAEPPAVQHHPTEGPVLNLNVGHQMVEIVGFLSAVAEARALRPDIPREAWVKVGRVRRPHFDPAKNKCTARIVIAWAEHILRGGR